jgi:hypothetical protein
MRSYIAQLTLVLLAALLVSAQQSCSDLNVKVTRTRLDSDLRPPVHWIGTEKNMLFLTRGGHVWASYDKGETFRDITRNLTGLSGAIAQIIPTAKDGAVLVATNNLDVWSSKDGGRSWTHGQSLASILSLQTHPVHDSWFAVQTINRACFDSTSCSLDLHLTTDGGATWALLTTYITEFSWGGAGLNGVPENQVLVVDWADKTGDFRSKPADQKRLVRSTSFFSSSDVILHNVIDFLYLNNVFLVAQRGKVAGGLQLLISEDYGAHWLTTRFPHSGALERRYTILGSELGAVVVNIEHEHDNWGNIYVSDRFGGNFSLSLRHNPRQQWGPCDFALVKGLEGIFLANEFLSESSDPEAPVSTERITKISFDLGGEWTRLSGPVDSVCTANNNCWLNLQGITTSYSGRFYSEPTAIGILLGTGNIGRALTDRTDLLNTYMSRDAGWTWQFFRNGSHQYDITNHGGIVLLIDDVAPTRSFIYTWNEGLAFTECAFATNKEKAFDLEGVISEPSGLDPHFFLYGREQGDAQPHGILLRADFDDLHERACHGWESPGTANSDYEHWMPSAARGDDCLLGHRDTFTRKKREAECLNPAAFNPLLHRVLKNCSCTREDYACAYCYELSENNECVLSCDDFDPKQAPKDCEGTWYETQGYRLVPGDTCDVSSGLNLLPIARACPPKAPTVAQVPVNAPSEENNTTSPVVTALLLTVPILAAIIFLFGLLYFLAARSQAVRNVVSKILPERLLPTFQPPASDYSSALQFNPNAPNILDEDLLQDDDDALQEDGTYP